MGMVQYLFVAVSADERSHCDHCAEFPLQAIAGNFLALFCFCWFLGSSGYPWRRSHLLRKCYSFPWNGTSLSAPHSLDPLWQSCIIPIQWVYATDCMFAVCECPSHNKFIDAEIVIRTSDSFILCFCVDSAIPFIVEAHICEVGMSSAISSVQGPSRSKIPHQSGFSSWPSSNKVALYGSRTSKWTRFGPSQILTNDWRSWQGFNVCATHTISLCLPNCHNAHS